MKIWLLETTDFSWDEYDAFVVAAETVAEAVKVVNRKQAAAYWTCTEVVPGDEPRIILGSFNAG